MDVFAAALPIYDSFSAEGMVIAQKKTAVGHAHWTSRRRRRDRISSISLSSVSAGGTLMRILSILYLCIE
jgi:hypothetical protein